MASRLLPLIVLLLSLGGCVARERFNANCRWTGDEPRRLDPGAWTDRQHLIDDAQLAEELAIRHADSIFKRAFAHPRAYSQARDACMAELFDEVARRHGVPAALVREAVDRSRLDFAAAIFLSFGVLYALVSWAVVRRIVHRFRDERGVALAVLLAASLVLSVAGSMVGEEWWGIGQGLRLHTSHASYRAVRNPWRQYRAEFLPAGVAAVCLLAPLAWRRPRSGQAGGRPS